MNEWVQQTVGLAEKLAASPGGTSNIPVLAMPLMSTSDTTTTALQAFNEIASGADDSIWIGMVEAYVKQGFTTIYVRPGWEMNGNFMPWSVTNETEAAAYIAAFQHIADVVRGVSGINVQMVWDTADLTNTAIPTQDMYPGNNYVDVIGTDLYDTLYPKSLYDWSTGTYDATIQQWWANPVNVEHFWDYPDGTQYRPQGIGLGWGLIDAMNFATANGKAFALPEVGAGGDGITNGPVDDAVFPEYLAQRLLASGTLDLAFVNIWERYGTVYEFTDGDHPAETAAWADFVKKIEQNDAGPSVTPAKIIVGHNQTTDLLATLNGLITPGRTGDTETISNFSAANGTVSIGANGAIDYVAGAAGTDTLTFTVTDQLGDVLTATETITIDAGPTIVAAATTLGHDQTFTIASLTSKLVTPGLKGDVETFSHVSSAHGHVSVAANGTISYTAPSSGTDTLTYTVTDQYGDSVTGSSTITIDPGPILTAGSLGLAHGASVNFWSKIYTQVAPGLPGDKETLISVVAQTGTIVFGANGAVTYTAPASGRDVVTFTEQDQLGDVASSTETITVDPASISGTIGHYGSATDPSSGSADGGVTVTLLNAAGVAVATAVTNSAGYYALNNLLPGTYQLLYTPPAGQAIKSTTKVIDPTTGLSASFTLVANEKYGAPRVPMVGGVTVPLGSVTGQVLNAAGGEANVSVALLSSTGATLATAVTAGDGTFAFNSLAAGVYQLDYTAPPGQYLVSGSADPATGLTPSLTLAAGQTLALANEVLGVITSSLSGSVVYAGAPDVGVSVALLNSTGSVVATDVTDTNGQFVFSSLTAGSYQLDYTPLSGQVPQTGGAADPVTDETAPIVLAQGQTLTLDPETMVAIPLGSFTGKVLNAAGGEANVSVALLSSTGTTLATTVTANDGSFAFTGLAAGVYELDYTAPPGQYLASGNANPATGLTPHFTLAAGQTLALANETLGVITSSLSGSVVYAGAPDVGVSVALLDSTGAVVATDSTDTNGQFVFSSLTAGSYQLDYTPLSGQVPQTGGAANPVTGETAPIALAQGQTLTLAPETMVPVVSLGGFTGKVLNAGGGEAGVSVTLLGGKGVTLATTVTDSNGVFSFSGLAAGVYRLDYTAPPGQYLVSGNANSATGLTPRFTLKAGQVVTVANEVLGVIPGSLNGSVVYAGAPDVGVSVSLLNSTGSVVATSVTDTNGQFGFSGLAAGSYQLDYTPLAGQMPQSGGAADPVTDETAPIVLAQGQTLTLAPETMVPVTATVSGTVLEDGTPESGVIVRLLDGSGNVLSKLVTDSNGAYSFTGLSAGTYGVKVVAPSGQVLQTGSAANPTSGIIPAVAVAAGQTAAMGTETLLANPARIDGSIHHYGSADPVYGTGQYGVVVSLLDAAGDVIATTTTSGSGWFTFGQLAAGSYQIQYTPPADEAVRASPGFNDATGLSSSFTVAAGQDLWLPNYGVTSISNTFDFSGNSVVALRGDGNYVVTGSATNGTLVLGNGNQNVTLTGNSDSVTTGAGTQSITLAGKGNQVTVGLGTATLNVGSGSATVHAAGGLVTITAGGANNLFDAGAGTNFLNADGSAGNVFMLNGGQQGLTTITGFNLAKTDVLDLARTLAGVNILPDLSNVGSYITASVSNGNTTLYTDVDAGGNTIANSGFAVLVGVSTSVNALINGHHISLA